MRGRTNRLIINVVMAQILVYDEKTANMKQPPDMVVMVSASYLERKPKEIHFSLLRLERDG